MTRSFLRLGLPEGCTHYYPRSSYHMRELVHDVSYVPSAKALPLGAKNCDCKLADCSFGSLSRLAKNGMLSLCRLCGCQGFRGSHPSDGRQPQSLFDKPPLACTLLSFVLLSANRGSGPRRRSGSRGKARSGLPGGRLGFLTGEPWSVLPGSRLFTHPYIK